MYCWSAPGAVAGLAERQALASYAPAGQAAVAEASGSLCSRALKYLLRTPLALCLSVLALVVLLGQASPMPGRRTVITEGKAATLRLVRLPQPMVVAVVVVAMVLLQCLSVVAAAASAQKV